MQHKVILSFERLTTHCPLTDYSLKLQYTEQDYYAQQQRWPVENATVNFDCLFYTVRHVTLILSLNRIKHIYI